MSQKNKKTKNKTNSGTKPVIKQESNKHEDSYEEAFKRFNDIVMNYASQMTSNSIYDIFSRAAMGFANQPQMQNARIKAISPLPVDYSKEDLGMFLVSPYQSERVIGQISHGLSVTSYPFFKIVKSEADILTYHNYIIPENITTTDDVTNDLNREYDLAEKARRAIRPKETAHLFAMQAGLYGKVFYILRSYVDKIHNTVNSLFAQQLPQDWCSIIGYNNISKYTISFNMMYFMQVGTDWRQYGDLFLPYIEDFANVVRKKKIGEGKFVYAALENEEKTIDIGNGYEVHINSYQERNNEQLTGNPRLFEQNGKWCYYVSLPIDRVWTYEINDAEVGVFTPYAGLLQTYAQQADYEAAQLSLILQPLVKIFTGEMENIDDRTVEGTFRPTLTMKSLFDVIWQNIMANSNTGGAAFYAAPYKNIKSHDYSESANANDVSQKFNSYATGKSGLSALIPVTDNPHQGVSEYSSKLESRFSASIYQTFEKMMNHYFKYELNLRNEFRFVMFGSIYTDDLIRANALKQIANGDTTQHYILAALDDLSIQEKISMAVVLENNGFMNHLKPPITSYTQSDKGAPTKTETEVTETKLEKTIQTED